MKKIIPLALALLFTALCGQAGAAAASRPNIIFVLADDLGIDGVSCYGADAHKTPQIDSLAASGTRFQTCYAAPLCGPSRCLLMTGRYAFRTGGLTNQSWRAGGPGAKAADEFPMAKILKQAGYATGQAGKWRQVGELPSDWGFDEFLTDNTASGWYWETRYNKNGNELKLPAGTYGPDVIQDFTFDFIRRHKDHPFFFYYAMHLVHKPTLRTPDTADGTKDINKLYDDNITYMDKQVGLLVAELEKLGLRQNTLIIFSGDNGTAAGYPSPVGGRIINGFKGSMLEGASRVPFIASWPGVTPAGKVLNDIVSFADPLVTFADLAGAKLPDGVKYDGQSIAPQLRGEPGAPRAWAYVQLGAHWYVREPGYKLNERGELFDMSDAPFVEKPVAAEADTDPSKAARQRLTAALAELKPESGKTDREGPPRLARRMANSARARVRGNRVMPWRDRKRRTWPARLWKFQRKSTPPATMALSSRKAAGRKVTQSIWPRESWRLPSARKGELTTITAKEPLGHGHFQIAATLHEDGAMALLVDGKSVAEGKAPGPIPRQPKAGLFVGQSGRGIVGEYESPNPFTGKVANVNVNNAEAK